MNSRRILLYSGLASLTLYVSSAIADPLSKRHADLHWIVEHADNILVARLTSGRLVELEGLPPCDYVYVGMVEKRLKGLIESKEVVFLSDARLSVGSKYLIFLSDQLSSDRFRNQFRILGNGKREPYYRDGIKWWKSCVDRLDEINDRVYLASGIYVKYLENELSESKENWLIHDPSIVVIMADPPLESRPDVLTLCRNSSNEEDCRIVRHVELVSEVSLMRWIENFVSQR